MDLTQTKLSKSEWMSIEVSVSDEEKKVLQLIVDGYANPALIVNETTTLLAILKIDESPEMMFYLYHHFFETAVRELVLVGRQNAYATAIQSWQTGLKKLKVRPPNSRDQIRVTNTAGMVETNRQSIFEFVCLDTIRTLVTHGAHAKSQAVALYTLLHYGNYKIAKLNPYIRQVMELVIGVADPSAPATISNVFHYASFCVEQNPALAEYEDRALYPHQKKLFSIFHRKSARYTPQLVLYMAPTGTGKTLSPIGLTQQYRVLFVCVARHVGLALAKSAISIGKKVAFAFGCQTASDIRLHYFSAVDYKINKRSGGIGKVDNSNGSKVELMICDVASYLTAMHYMLAFNPEDQIITYWDEPTITMDYATHDLHATIHENWKQNKIAKIVLSCATLPKQHEIAPTIRDYTERFSVLNEDDGTMTEPEIHVIDSYDTKKSIALLNKEGKAMLPHYLFSEYSELVQCVKHVEANKTLLRYLDVDEIVQFVKYVCDAGWVSSNMHIATYFDGVDKIDMKSLKHYYLQFLTCIHADRWPTIFAEVTQKQHSKLYLRKETVAGADFRKVKSVQDPLPAHIRPPPMPASASGGGELRRLHSVASVPMTSSPHSEYLYSDGVLLTTKDAYTLTYGPTIFLAEDVDKVGLFYIQQANIPETMLQTILTKIEKNNKIQQQMEAIEQMMEDKEIEDGTQEKTKKAVRTMDNNVQMSNWKDQMDALKTQIEPVTLNPKYIPNTVQHQEVWVPAGYAMPTHTFVPNVDQEDVKAIMALSVDNQKKLLLIMGIGVFSLNNNVEYGEIMKKLALNKRLFLIIASSDYIYGTNYQFAHGILGRDLLNMTQQKTIQAIGRIGRNSQQQYYTVRFRDNAILKKLFLRQEFNMEGVVMSRLFTSGDSE